MNPNFLELDKIADSTFNLFKCSISAHHSFNYLEWLIELGLELFAYEQ